MTNTNHLQDSFGSREPGLHNLLKEWFTSELLVLGLKGHTNNLQHLLNFLLLILHDCLENLADGIHDELTEGPLEVTTVTLPFPFLAFLVVEPVTPKLLHKSLFVGTELGSVCPGKLLKGETPLVKS